MNPINYLQEYCQKTNSLLPIYDVTDHKIFPNANSFTIRVTIGSLKAEGTASNKKAAKFKAAENMILLMNPNNCVNFKTANNSNTPGCTPEKVCSNNCENIPNTSLSSNSLNNSLSMVDGNFVGKLQEFCVQRKLKIPVYVSDVGYCGAGHKLICQIGDFSENAIALNKKIAKQACAEKMWQHLMKIEGNLKQESIKTNLTKENVDSFSFSFEKLKIDETIDIQSSIERAKQLYSQQQQTGAVSDSGDVLIKDYHSNLKNSLTPDTLKKVCKYLDGLQLDVINGGKIFEHALKEICTLLGVDFKAISLTSIEPNKFIFAYTINTVPTCTGIGIGNCSEVAKINAIIHSVNIIREILQ